MPDEERRSSPTDYGVGDEPSFNAESADALHSLHDAERIMTTFNSFRIAPPRSTDENRTQVGIGYSAFGSSFGAMGP
jgi:hypothetical protein